MKISLSVQILFTRKDTAAFVIRNWVQIFESRLKNQQTAGGVVKIQKDHPSFDIKSGTSIKMEVGSQHLGEHDTHHCVKEIEQKVEKCCKPIILNTKSMKVRANQHPLIITGPT